MRGQFLAGLDAVDEGIDLILEHIGCLEHGLIFYQGAVLSGVDLEFLTILQTDACLSSHKVHIHLIFTDILRPGAMDSDGGTFSPNQGGDRVVYIVHTVILGRASPHIGKGILSHIDTQLGECFAGHGQGLRIAAAVHHQIQEMDTPVDQRAAARNRLGGKCAAQAGDGTVGTEAGINMEHFAQLAGIDILFDQVDSGVEAVDHTDVQNLAGLMLDLLHLQSFCVSPGSGLLAQHILAGPQSVHGNDRMHVVGRADRNCLNFGVVQSHMVICDSLTAAVLLHSGLGTLRDNVAEINDFRIRIVHVRGNMSAVCNGTATDNCNFHSNSPLISGQAGSFPFSL